MRISVDDCPTQQIFEYKDDCVNIPVNFTKINEKLAVYRQQKRQ